MRPLRLSHRSCLAAPAWLAVWLAVSLWLAAFGRPVQAAEWSPTERTDQPWKVVSLLEDGGLSHLNVFNLDFERNTNSPRWGTAWIATSDGLHEYDGYTWRRHGRTEGLPSDFVRCVLVTRAGAVWVGTDQGAGLYDGKTFRTLGSETNLAGPNVRRITEDTDGSIWFCSDSWPNAGAGGGLTSLRDGQWKAYREADGLPSGYVVNYFRDRSGRQFAATLKGLAEFTAGRWGAAFAPPAGGRINWGSGCLAETTGTGLLYSTGSEVFRLQEGAWRPLPTGIPHEHGIVATADGAVVAVGRPSQGRSVFLEWAGDRWVPASAEFSTPRGYTEDIREAPDGSVWVAGYDCLVRWARKGSQWREFTDLPPPRLVDAQGGVWFAQTRGLFTPGGLVVRLHQGRWEPLATAYDALVNHRLDGSVWGWSSNRLTRWQGTNRTDYTPAQTGLESYVAAHGDARHSFWLLGHDARGHAAVVRHTGNRWEPVPVPELAGLNLWPTSAGSSNGVWFAGDRGVGTAVVLVRVAPGGNLKLDASVQQTGTMRMNFREDRYGAVWLYGDAGLFRWVLGTSVQWDRLGDLPATSVVSCVERGDELWFGYNGATGGRSALIGLRNGAWTHFPVATLGHLSLAHDGTLFADGVGQIFRIANRPDAVPVVQQLRTAEPAQSVVQDLAGDLWVGTDQGVFQFRSDPQPLRLVLSGASRVPAGDPLPVTATALDRFRAQGAGLGAVFSSRVDDGEWSPFAPDGQIKVAAPRLKRGPHRLEVRCQDAAGNRRSEPAVHHFQVVAIPLQERGWFVPGILGLAAVMMTLALVALNARRRLAEYARTLEGRVTERTAELEQDIRRREKVEASLRASELRFARLFQASPLLALVSDLADEGRIVDANPRFCEALGFTREEVLGHTAAELRLWQDPTDWDRLLAAVRKGGVARNLEFKVRTRAGRCLNLLVSAERAELATGPALLVFGADITDRRELETRLQHLGDNLPESYVYQLAREPDGGVRFLHVSGGVERVHGVTAAAAMRDAGVLLGLMDPAQVPAFEEASAVSARDLTDFSMEVRVCGRNGKWGWFTFRAHPHREEGGRVVWDGVVTDVTARREAAAALRESEERFAMAFNASPVIIAITTYPEGRYVDVNQAFVRSSGFQREEVLGRRSLELGIWAKPEQREEIIRRLADGKPVRGFECLQRRKSGELMTVEAAYERIVLGNRPCILAINIDITERKRAEEARLASEARYRALFEYAPDGILIADSGGRCLDANASMCRMLGYGWAELTGRPATDVFAPAEHPAIGLALADLGAGRDHHREWTFRRQDGSLFPAEVRATRLPDGNLLATVRDLTERNRAEASLRAKDELLRLVIDLVPHFIFAKDRNSRFLFVNRVAAEAMELTPAELVGRNDLELPRARAEAEAFMRDDQEVLTGGKPKFVPEETLTDSHGRVRIHQTTKIPFLMPGTHEPALLGVAVDITEQKRAERALRASEARLSEAQRIAKVGSWEWDLVTGQLEWSDETFRLFELEVDRSRPFYQAYRNLIHPDDAGTVDRAYAEARERKTPYVIVHRLLFPCGRIKWVQEHGEFEYSAAGTPVRSRGTMQDVTAQHEAVATGILLAAIVDSSADAIIGKDVTGRVTSWNAAAERLFGWTAAEMLGQSIVRIVPPDRLDEEAGILARIRAGERVDQFETERLRKTGGPIEVAVTVSPIRDAAGQVVGASKIARDITESRRMRRLLEWEMRALERLSSSASLGEVLHDLALGLELHAPGAICSILLLDDDGTHLRHGAAPSLPETYNRLIDGVAIGPEVGSCGTAAYTNSQVFVADIAGDPLWANFRDLALSHGLRACWSTPIPGSSGKLLGTFAVYYREPRTPSLAELDLIDRAQHLVGLAIERKRAEETLQMTRLSVDRAADSVFWVNRDGSIDYANDAACASRGYSREELQRMSIFDLDPDYQPGVWETHFEELKQQGALTLETRHRTKAGRVFPIEVNANYVCIREQEYNFCFVRDITVRRRTERRREVEHAVARALAEAASVAEAVPEVLRTVGRAEGWEFGEIWKWDRQDGRLSCLELWSGCGPRSAALERETREFRCEPGQELPGRVHQSGKILVIPDLAQAGGFRRAGAAADAGLRAAIGFPLGAGGRTSGVMAFLSSNPVELDSELAEMLGTVGSQIGQFMARQLAQEELQRFVALSPSVIYALRITPAGLRAYWVSENLFNLTGYHPSESIHGTWWADHLHPDDRARVLAASPAEYDSEHQVLDFRFRRKDGSYVWLRDEKRLFRDAAGRPAEIVGAWTDITERMALEKQLRQAQKMEAIGLLSGGIAHDFNNLLGTIIGNAQLAGLDLTPDHPAAESLEQILTASRRAAHLVQQILTFARQERTERHRIDPVPVVEESLRLLRATLPAGVHLTLIKGERLPAVLADETQIQQVLINLGTNSWHALEGRSGRISVELSAVEVDRELAAGSPDLQPGHYLRIRVEDTGKGMDAPTLERIFEPFFTTKEAGKGTGLGLSVVHGIIKAHGGAITVQSAVGVGTTFDLFLPAAAGDAAGRSGPEASLRPGHGEQLLLVDDQGEMLRTNRRALERLGYRVVACKDAAEALVRFRAEPDAFALVLTDLNMPGMSGVELARNLLALRPGLPVLLSSGFVTEDLRQTAMETGVCGLLRKPATLQELSDTIHKNLHRGP